MSGRPRHSVRLLVPVVLVVAVSPAVAYAQLGSLASPGPLSRAHAPLEGISKCQSCHEPGRQVSATRCLTCHKPIADRIARRTGVHREVTGDCAVCHVEHNGIDAELRPLDTSQFDHGAETSFALDGRHAGVACARCHTTRSFLAASPACATCHRDVHRGTLGQDCVRCHPTAVAFRQAAAGFDHGRTAFALTGRHQQVACARCHSGGRFRGLSFSSCASCHADPHAAKLSSNCAACHTTAGWRTQRVDHARTRFPLVGRHESVPCARCHVQSPVKVRLKFAACADCHADPHRGRFQDGCESCHKEGGFARAPFDHQARTGFALTGRHGALACAKCHQGIAPAAAGTKRVVDFGGTKRECAACHGDPHKGELGERCETCHGTDSFRVTRFTHARAPAFYAGGHAGLTCAQCHARAPLASARTGAPAAGMTFRNTPTACASCHRDVHLGQVGTACDACHRVDGAKFAPVGFSHARTAFQLTGRHEQVACEKCHVRQTGTFPRGTGEARRLKGLGTACSSCHEDPHLGQLGTRCDACHTTSGFAVSGYTHLDLDGFFGKGHAALECVQCHRRTEDDYPAGHGVAVKFLVGRECTACHRDAHAGSMGTTCSACHTPDLWQNPNRAFHKVGAFPLTGRHLAAPCASCHVQGQLKGTPLRCYDCHWIRRQDDLYHLRLGGECEDCHRPSSWTAVTWDHGARTGTALNVAHRLLACDACHKERVFGARLPQCISCHDGDYRRARSPDHAAAGFPVVCEVCHQPSAPTFAGARFSHASFDLRGAHAAQACDACHRSNVYRGTARACLACHQAEYQRTQAPNHAAAGFPTDCQVCHRDGGPGWSGATGFNHAAFFPLAGAHGTAACSACHRSGIYKGTPRDCFSCHQAEYQGTTNPNHAAAGFGTTCDTCHRSGGPAWVGTFKHAQFFALVGDHAAQSCSACHKNGVYKGTPRDCAGCHLSQYRGTSNPNHAAAGFPTTCDACHRATDGSWNQGRFSHPWFPITSGKHAGNPCSACHQSSSNYASFTCLTCHDRSKTDQEHSGRAGYRYDSNACYSCHPTGRGD